MTYLHSLIQDTLLFLKEKQEEQKEWLSLSGEPSVEKKAPQIILPQELPQTPQVTQVPKQKEIVSGRMAALDQMKVTLSHASSTLRLLPKPVEVYLVCFEKKPDTLKFLESVAVAINEQLTTAGVVHCKDEKEFQRILQTPFLKLVLVSGRAGEVHQIEGNVMTLADVTLYQSDPQLKRALWNLLKSRFLPPSSSTSRSTKL